MVSYIHYRIDGISPALTIYEPDTYHLLKVHYVGSEETAVKRGGGGGTVAEVVLPAGEWIRRIEGTYRPQVISSLKFVSNTGSAYNASPARTLWDVTYYCS